MTEQPDWRSLSHAYGTAVDTPGQLAALRTEDRDVRNQAWEALIGSANHQGGLYTVTPWIIGPLIDLASDPDYPDRITAAAHAALIVEDLAYVAGEPSDRTAEFGTDEEKRLLAECRQAAASRSESITVLATDADAEMRLWGCRLAGVLARSGGDSSVLWELLRDTDPSVRAVALWQLCLTPDQRHEATEYATDIATDDLERTSGPERTMKVRAG